MDFIYKEDVSILVDSNLLKELLYSQKELLMDVLIDKNRKYLNERIQLAVYLLSRNSNLTSVISVKNLESKNEIEQVKENFKNLCIIEESKNYSELISYLDYLDPVLQNGRSLSDNETEVIYKLFIATVTDEMKIRAKKYEGCYNYLPEGEKININELYPRLFGNSTIELFTNKKQIALGSLSNFWRFASIKTQSKLRVEQLYNKYIVGTNYIQSPDHVIPINSIYEMTAGKDILLDDLIDKLEQNLSTYAKKQEKARKSGKNAETIEIDMFSLDPSFKGTQHLCNLYANIDQYVKDETFNISVSELKKSIQMYDFLLEPEKHITTMSVPINNLNKELEGDIQYLQGVIDICPNLSYNPYLSLASVIEAQLGGSLNDIKEQHIRRRATIAKAQMKNIKRLVNEPIVRSSRNKLTFVTLCFSSISVTFYIISLIEDLLHGTFAFGSIFSIFLILLLLFSLVSITTNFMITKPVDRILTIKKQVREYLPEILFYLYTIVVPALIIHFFFSTDLFLLIRSWAINITLSLIITRFLLSSLEGTTSKYKACTTRNQKINLVMYTLLMVCIAGFFFCALYTKIDIPTIPTASS
ncbi:hypothetical protein NEOKW01_1346 [Nematocida sp. AWRm80]|nr:hypothetical protein NEOKW01_1346 [Nematocida sp. AWRm80]